MNETFPIITKTDCGDLIVNVDITPTLDIIEKGVTYDCATAEYGVVLSVNPDGSVVSSYDRYLSGGSYSAGFLYFSGHGVSFMVDVSPLLSTGGDFLNLSGGTLTGQLNAPIISASTISATSIFATTLFVTNEKWTIELMDIQITSMYAPYDLTINSITNILNSPTITLQDDGVAYVLGNLIASGSKIGITSNIASVISLNIVK